MHLLTIISVCLGITIHHLSIVLLTDLAPSGILVVITGIVIILAVNRVPVSTQSPYELNLCVILILG